MIRTYTGLPTPLLPPSSPLPPAPLPPFPLMRRGCIAKASLMFTNASQKYRRYTTDHLSKQSAIVTECSANIRLYRRCFGEHSPNHRKSIFFIGTAGIYAQNRKASGSMACIIIHFTIADAKIPNGTEALGLHQSISKTLLCQRRSTNRITSRTFLRCNYVSSGRRCADHIHMFPYICHCQYRRSLRMNVRGSSRRSSVHKARAVTIVLD